MAQSVKHVALLAVSQEDVQAKLTVYNLSRTNERLASRLSC